MEVLFQTKLESKNNQQKAFLKLSGVDRIASFFELSKKINKFPLKNKVDKTIGNFILEK